MSHKRRNHLPITGARSGIRVEGHAERCGFYLDSWETNGLCFLHTNHDTA